MGPASTAALSVGTEAAPRRPRPRAPGVAFGLTVAAVLAYALRGGGYDIVVREEHAVLIWWLIGVGYAFGLLPRTRPSRGALVLLAALLAYAAWTAVSLGWSPSSERTTAEVARVLGYLGVATLVVSALDRRTWHAAAGGLVCAAGVVCLIAVVSRLAPGAFPRSPFFDPVLANRLSYPFGYWNAVGAWAAMTVALGLAWSAHDPRPLRRAATLGVVPIAAVCAYLTYSRGAVVGEAVAVIGLLALSRNRVTALVHVLAAALATAIAVLVIRHAPAIAHGIGSRGAARAVLALLVATVLAAAVGVLSARTRLDAIRAPRTPALRVGAAALVALVLAGVVVGPRLASRAWHDFRHPAVAETVTDPASRLTQLGGVRYYYWQAALDDFRAHPVLGTGSGTFQYWWDSHATTGDFIRNAHSLELETMAELGAPGLGLVLAVLGAAAAVLARARRRPRRPATVAASTALLVAFLVFVTQASVDWMWQSTAVTVLALTGAAAASMRLRTSRPRMRAVSRALVVGLAAVSVVVELPGLGSTLAVRRSQAAERAHDGAVALAWANVAVGVEPWAASPYQQRGLVLEAAGRYADAQADLRRAVIREPDDFAHWLLLARVEGERGHVAAARRDLAVARRLRPKAGVFLPAI